MRTLFLFGFLLLIQSQSYAQKNIRFQNGNWFDGESFVKKELYSVDGVFSETKPSRIDTVINLASKYIIPPFVDAHSHNFGNSYTLQSDLEEHILKGVFYIKVLNNSKRGASSLDGLINIPQSVDVLFAHGGLTSNYSHPIEVYEALALGFYSYEQQVNNAEEVWNSRKMEDDAYFIIDNLNDLNNKWDTIKAGEPDILKVFLRNSEVYDQRRNFRPKKIQRYDDGISPDLLPVIVKLAHSEGLKVSSSSNSFNDFKIAIEAGVDHVTHLPCNQVRDEGEECLITMDVAKKAASQGVEITVIVNEFEKGTRTEEVDQLSLRNIELLNSLDANISFGSNQYGKSLIEGLIAFSNLNIFRKEEILNIATYHSLKYMYPNRRAGKLMEGYEASFLVLNENPLLDFSSIKDIKVIMKQGYIILTK